MTLDSMLDAMEVGDTLWLKPSDLGLTAKLFHAEVFTWQAGDGRFEVIETNLDSEGGEGLIGSALIRRTR